MRIFAKSLLNRGLWAVLAVVVTTGCGQDAKVQRHLVKADGYKQSGDIEKARIEYLNVIQLDFSNRVAIVELANIYYAQERFQEAFPLLNYARQLDPTNTVIQLRWAGMLVNAGSTNRLLGRTELLNILQRDPNNQEALAMWADSANVTNATELATVRQRLQALQQKTGDRAIYHLVNRKTADS